MTDSIVTIECADLDSAIEMHRSVLGYRLDMITPADSPTTAVMSLNGGSLRLRTPLAEARIASGEWVTGRAGMAYRDLIPGRLAGRLIASHIRLLNGGPLADYVHYHKVEFQSIFCVKGAIRVVYEDQGPPFWLKPGDLVLQPPEIRHRVLEAEAGSEVIELGVPAVHETWVEHEFDLPTPQIDRARDFGGQYFVRHVAADSVPVMIASGVESVDAGVTGSTSGMADLRVLSGKAASKLKIGAAPGVFFVFQLDGHIDLAIDGEVRRVNSGAAFVVDAGKGANIAFGPGRLFCARLEI